jgi:NADH:ubiquinone oxidoreductase subunit 3 (subunit A)
MTGIWYVIGLAGAGVGFVFLVIALAWLLSHRNNADLHKGLPYESFDVEVVFLFHWAIAFRDLMIGGIASMGTFVLVLLVGLAYAWRKGVLTWH